MQNETHDGFGPVPPGVLRVAKAALSGEQCTQEELNAQLAKAPRPTLFVGEVVDVKGMKFKVINMKANGRIRLKMVPDWKGSDVRPL